jgi:hypothetical protein
MDTEQRAAKGDGSIGTVDGQGTTAMRNAIDLSSLSSWMVLQPALSDLLSIDTDTDIDSGGREGSSSSSSMSRGGRLADRISIRQFGFGQSNPTYMLAINDGVVGGNDSSSSSAMRLVLRRKPDSIAHPTSHDLRREYRVLEGLARYNARLLSSSESSSSSSSSSGNNDANYFDKSIPVPRPYVYCSDESVVGSEFYLMEFVEGRIFVDPRMSTMDSREERSRAYRDAIRVLSVREENDVFRRRAFFFSRITFFFSLDIRNPVPSIVSSSVRIFTTSRGPR